MDDALDEGEMKVPGLELHVLEQCASTNTLLLAGEFEPPCLLVAEEQTAGRGRRGRRWYSGRSVSATFSVSYVSRRPLRELGGLSLVAGVAAAQALRALGAEDTRLKWPNDLVVGEDKLGGILVETRAVPGKKAAGTLAVIGIGINLRASSTISGRVARGIASLDRCIVAPRRSRVIGAIGKRLVDALARFEAEGLGPMRAQWEALDSLYGKRVRVRVADGRVLTGVASGLAEDGALRLRTARGLRTVHSARVVAARPLIIRRR
jgi:BirA family biotin operon repressor/biotin-[acetyl-CoA-carboxylase] ligase